MKLAEIIPEGGVLNSIQATEKHDVLEEMTAALIKAGCIPTNAKDKVVKALTDREQLGSTGIGAGVAVPHAKHDSITDLVGAFGRSEKGINFDALDGEPVYAVFLLLSSKNASGSHLEALAYISRLVRDEKFVRFLCEAKDEKEIRELLEEADQSFGTT